MVVFQFNNYSKFSKLIFAPTIAAESPEAKAQRSVAFAEDLQRKAWPQ